MRNTMARMIADTATRWGRITAGPIVVWLLAPLSLLAQSVCLPAPRLLTTFPMGGQAGTKVEVRITGQSIEDAGELRFSHPGITATAKLDAQGKPLANQYLVTISGDCPVGIHEARVMTRLGLSTSRVFSVGELPEVLQTKPNTSLDQAMPLEVNSVCNGVMSVKSVDHYRFEAAQGRRVLVDCAARGIDSKLNAVLIVGDAQGRDLIVQRRGAPIDFVAPQDGVYTVKVHELTFKGGPEYFYRLSLRDLPADADVTCQPKTQAVNAFSWPPPGLPPQADQQEVEPNDGLAQVQKITLP
ncbi:MAG: serine protease, partial [Pirellulales bacterium]|nr:serine protease [Pirellulales bacterium]